MEVRDSKFVSLVLLTYHCSIHASLLLFRKRVIQQFLARGSTSEMKIGARSPESPQDLQTVTNLQHSGPNETS